jgi:hypothetical protein
VGGSSLVTLSYSQKVRSLFKSLKVSKANVLEPHEWNEAAITDALEIAHNQKPSFNLEQEIEKNQAFLSHALDM